MRFSLSVAACVLTAVAAFGQLATSKKFEAPKPEPKKVEAREIDLAEHKVEFNKEAKLTAPLKLTSAGDLKLSPLEPLASSVKVDFKSEYVLLFQWEGSGKDKLTSTAETTKDGKTVFTFTLKPGETKDLRGHSKAFILPAGAEWKVVK